MIDQREDRESGMVLDPCRTGSRGDARANERAKRDGEEGELVSLLDCICDGGCIADRTATMARIADLLQRAGVDDSLRKRAMDVMGRLARRFEHEPACVSGLNVMKTRVRGGR